MSNVLVFNDGVYLPPLVQKQLPKGAIKLDWSEHALRQAAADDFFFAPEVIEVGNYPVVEVETTQALAPFKMVLRIPGHEAESARNGFDMVIVAVKLALKDTWKVVTSWGNHVSDHHATLRTGRCVSPPVLCPA